MLLGYTAGGHGGLIPADTHDVDRVASERAIGKRAARDPLKLHLAQMEMELT